MPALRKGLVAFIAVLLTVWIVPAMLDWNRYRTEIAQFAAAELGRPVTIGGDVTLKLLPRTVLTAADVTFPDQGDGVSAHLQALRLEVAVGPLLRGRLVVRDLVLGAPALTLPWPLPARLGSPVPPYVRHPFTARVEGGSVALGGVRVTGIDAAVRSEAATGALRIQGAAALAGAPWRFTTTLGAPDSNGKGALSVFINGQGAFEGTSGGFAGSLAQGIVTGQVEGRGRDLAALAAAPHGPWQVRGPFSAAAGLLALPALDFSGPGVHAKARVLLRITRPAGLDLGISAQTLDAPLWAPLWAPLLAAMQAPALKLHLALDALHVSMLGGDVEHAQLTLALEGGQTRVERVMATLPGGARLRLSGTAGRNGAGFFLEGPASLDAPDLRATLAWLHPLAPTLIGLPSPHRASIAGQVRITSGTLSLSGLTGTLDGAKISGGFGIARGARPGFGMGIVLDALALDNFAGPGTWPTLDGDIFIRAASAMWHGQRVGALDAALHSAPAGLTLKHLTLTGATGQMSLAGTLGSDFSLAGVHGSAATQNVTALAEAAARFGFPARLLQPGLWQGGATVEMNASGPPHAWRMQLRADAGDLRAEAQASIDASTPSVQATITVRHPGAPRLLAALGAEHADRWLETGSFALLARLTATPGHVHVANLDVTAASLRASARADANISAETPAIDATIDADTLPLPWRENLPLAWLQGWNGTLHLHAAQVLADLRPLARDLRTDVTVQNGAILAHPLAAGMGGGSISGEAAADVSQVPARIAARLDLSNVMLPDRLTGLPLDIGAGTWSGSADIFGTGAGGDAWRASCSGIFALQLGGGSIAGLDMPQVTRLVAAHRLSARPLDAALSSGASPDIDGALSGSLDHGRLTLGPATLTSPAGALKLSGTLLLDGSASDIIATVTPAAPSPPGIQLHVTGPWSTAHVQTDISLPAKRKDTHPRRK